MGMLRVREFYNQASQCENEEALRSLVETERSYLDSAYRTLASKKNAYTAYRNYMRDAFYKHPTIESDALHSVIKCTLRLNESEDRAFQLAHKEQVGRDNTNLRPICDVDAHINTAVRLLKSSSYLEVIVGLAALTGRRTAEIGTSARFTPVDEATVRFEGQLKVKEREGIRPYDIPVLHDSKAICHHLARIRELRPDLIGSPQKFHDGCGRNINVRTKKHFAELYEGSIKPKDLRAIYAEICFRLYGESGNQRISQVAYYAKVLGHGELDLTTAHSYLDFYIADERFE